VTGYFILFLIAVGLVAFLAHRASQSESKEVRSIHSLPPSVQHVVEQMDNASQAAFFNEYELKKKKLSIGYVLWLIFGFHYLYYGKGWLQLFYWVTLGGLGIWALIDLFRMPSIRDEANEQIARQTLQTLHIGAAFGSPQSSPRFTHSSPSPPSNDGPTEPRPPSTTPGWYGDPWGVGKRWWDGSRWTRQTSR
jgi:hypothetical protein